MIGVAFSRTNQDNTYSYIDDLSMIKPVASFFTVDDNHKWSF